MAKNASKSDSMFLTSYDIILDTSGEKGWECTFCNSIYTGDPNGKCLAFDIEIRSQVNLCLTCRNAKAAKLEMKIEELAEELKFDVISGKRAVASLLGLQKVFGNKKQLADVSSKIDELVRIKPSNYKPYCRLCSCLGDSLSCIICMNGGYKCQGSCFCCSNKEKELERDVMEGQFEVVPPVKNKNPDIEGFFVQNATGGLDFMAATRIPDSEKDPVSKNLSFCFCCKSGVKSKPCQYCMKPNLHCSKLCHHCNDKEKEAAETSEDKGTVTFRIPSEVWRKDKGAEIISLRQYYCSCCDWQLNKTPCSHCIKHSIKCDPKCESCNADKKKKDGDTSENQPRKTGILPKNELSFIGDYI